MKLSREEQKRIALTRMNQLNIFKPYIKAFEKDDVVTVFENFGGFWATKDNGREELENKIHELEEKYGILIYAVTHEYTGFMGETYSFLHVSSYSEDELDDKILIEENVFYPFCYVWNATEELFSEFGEIGVISFGGGIKRTF